MSSLVKPGLGETLPALLERRRGIAPRTTLLATAALVVAGIVVYLLVRDPLEGRTQIVHREAPVFNTLYEKGVVHPVEPREDELQRFEARRGDLRLAVTVRPLELPPYQGELTGTLPMYAERHIRDLQGLLPNFELTGEGKARVQRNPGYQVLFRYGDPERPASGTDVFVFPEDFEPEVRDGVIVTFRHEGGPRAKGEPGHREVRAMRSTFRSFAYGTGRP
jgi:hypothetical protein